MQGSRRPPSGTAAAVDPVHAALPSQAVAESAGKERAPITESTETEETEETEEAEEADEAQRRVKELLTAYQLALEKTETLAAVVFLPWDRSGPGKYIKIPYLRWFLRFFITHHVSRSLNLLNRRLHATAALADDPDANRSSREMIKLFLQSLPSPPYRGLIFAAIAAALVIALPLQAFGNVFYVLDLVGSLLRADVGYLGRAFASKELVPTLRSLLVLVMGLLVVAGLLSSPFGLKRALFNSYPWRERPLHETAARSHGHAAGGIYALEADVFADAGAEPPREGRWDLWFHTFVLALLGMCALLLTLVTVAAYLGSELDIELSFGEDDSGIGFVLPELPWVYYALATALVYGLCVLLLWRLNAAWRVRRPRRAALEAAQRKAARSGDVQLR